MSASARDVDPDDIDETFPEGWQLGSDSWSFHRQFRKIVGRASRQGEYTAIITQIRYKIAEPLARHYWRVSLADGTPIVVKGGWMRMLWVEPGDYTPRPPRVWLIKPFKTLPSAVASPPTAPQPRVRAPPVADLPPQQPLRASTLTLKSPTAARLVAERLRKAGIPVRSLSS